MNYQDYLGGVVTRNRFKKSQLGEGRAPTFRKYWGAAPQPKIIGGGLKLRKNVKISSAFKGQKIFAVPSEPQKTLLYSNFCILLQF